MKKWFIALLLVIVFISLTGCSQQSTTTAKKQVKIGIMLTDSGLGDGSFSDAAFQGLEKARDNLNIQFDYRQPVNENYDKSLEELIKEKNDVIVGLGFSSQAAIEKMADKYPKQQFVLIDAVSTKKNVTSITFKEQEGSFLLGVLAGLETKTNVVGFIGGQNVEVIHHFQDGFEQGVHYVNKNAKVLVDYANTFNDDKVGSKLAKKQIAQNADYIYPAAGFTGVGALKAAEASHVFAFGVDSDQFDVAEKAVVSSMVKHVDVALYNIADQLANGKPLSDKNETLGLKENGVGLAPIRIIQLPKQDQNTYNQIEANILSGKIKVKP